MVSKQPEDFHLMPLNIFNVPSQSPLQLLKLLDPFRGENWSGFDGQLQAVDPAVSPPQSEAVDLTT